MRNPLTIIIILVVLLLLDVYVFQAIRSLAGTSRYRSYIYASYWLVFVLCIAGLLLVGLSQPESLGRHVRTYLFAFIVMLTLAKLAAAAFLLTDDVRRFVQYGAQKLITRHSLADVGGGENISRSAFLSWMGLAAGATIFGSMLYGFSNKYSYTIKRIRLSFGNLPTGFKGLKIVQISDIHSGSLEDIKAVAHGVKMIQDQQPDLILFTGDLVNDRADEMQPLYKLFSSLSAPMGVYAVLGNHDYGDYVQWPYRGLTQAQNLENLKKVFADMGWRLLLNEHVIIECKGDKIALLGIENWSAKGHFGRHGKMSEAYPGTENIPFKILMSHDPSHWDAEVRPYYPDIDLTLSGHTHGMQMGVETPAFKWSPVQYMYKQWAGLYEEGNQKLYVNRGFGFIGYPGRLGILPEITVFEFV